MRDILVANNFLSQYNTKVFIFADCQACQHFNYPVAFSHRTYRNFDNHAVSLSLNSVNTKYLQNLRRPSRKRLDKKRAQSKQYRGMACHPPKCWKLHYFLTDVEGTTQSSMKTMTNKQGI